MKPATVMVIHFLVCHLCMKKIHVSMVVKKDLLFLLDLGKNIHMHNFTNKFTR